jgi:hypothetical protein
MCLETLASSGEIILPRKKRIADALILRAPLLHRRSTKLVALIQGH